jgi:hypothetical protein
MGISLGVTEAGDKRAKDAKYLLYCDEFLKCHKNEILTQMA